MREEEGCGKGREEKGGPRGRGDAATKDRVGFWWVGERPAGTGKVWDNVKIARSGTGSRYGHWGATATKERLGFGFGVRTGGA